jgi:Zn-dependent protease
LPSIDFAQAFTFFLVLLISLTVHEAAHAWSADRLGDRTARMLGRVSLNPAVHVDPIGTILFPLMALFTGFPLIGWAKPVPVDVNNLRGHWRRKYMLIAAAGPASNVLLALLAAAIFRAFDPEVSPLALVLYGLIQLNVLLAVFNMLPVPPLDGGNVLSGMLSGGMAEALDRLRPYGFLILYLMMFSGALWAIVGPVERWAVSRLVGL